MQDPAITVQVKLIDFEWEASALIWTTTLDCLRLAICAGPDVEYSAVQDGASGSVYLLASARLMAYYKE